MAEPTLRKDAARNRERLLIAGREVFAQRGLDATLNDVARHAGVGVGTAYRRFANKEELLEAIFVQQIDDLETILRSALAEPDPWVAVVCYLEGSLAMQARDLGMAQILSGRFASRQRYDAGRDRIAPLVNRLADRGRAAGVLRDDVTGTDLILLQVALTSIAALCRVGPDVPGRDDTNDLYRRYLWLVLDGLRPRDDGLSPLPVPALTTSQTHVLLGSDDAPDPDRSAD